MFLLMRMIESSASGVMFYKALSFQQPTAKNVHTQKNGITSTISQAMHKHNRIDKL